MLVAKGFKQKLGMDYYKTYPPVARLETIWTIIAPAIQKNWKLYQLDVKSALLNGYLEEEIYVEQPEGFLVEGGENKVFKIILRRHYMVSNKRQEHGIVKLINTL